MLLSTKWQTNESYLTLCLKGRCTLPSASTVTSTSLFDAQSCPEIRGEIREDEDSVHTDHNVECGICEKLAFQLLFQPGARARLHACCLRWPNWGTTV